jgi:Protein of unknown function (DUF2934)
MPNRTATKRALIPPSKQRAQRGEIPELHDRIALRAYEIFEKRGRAQGDDLQDWLRAEQEILGEQMDTDLG